MKKLTSSTLLCAVLTLAAWEVTQAETGTPYGSPSSNGTKSMPGDNLNQDATQPMPPKGQSGSGSSHEKDMGGRGSSTDGSSMNPPGMNPNTNPSPGMGGTGSGNGGATRY